MVSVNANILLLLLPSLTALAAPAGNVDWDTSPAVDAGLDLIAASNSPPAEVTVMTDDQVSAFTPYTYYAAAGYCSPSLTETWSCGSNCNATSGFKPIASGGDGSFTQFWYVGYDPTLETIIVVHQGTDIFRITPILTDLDIPLAGLRLSLFPGVSPAVKVHSGFGDAHARAANDIFSAVATGVKPYGTNSVTTVGHSLGAAISLLDAISLPLRNPDLTVTHYGYGLPRVGNEDFASYVDSNFGGRFTRITNLRDPIPIVPFEEWGYRHPSGEAHIDNGEVWMWCPGQDNPDARCSVGDTPNPFQGDVHDHDGPYNGIEIGCRVH